MCTKATKTTRKATTPRAVKLLNAACPRCDGPIYSCPVRWLFCPRCKPAKPSTPSSLSRPIPYTLAIPTEAAA